jgi:hypothetical protein
VATERQLFFVFKSAHAARIFVWKLVDENKLRDLAIYVEHECVMVIDGNPNVFRRERICQIARTSGADLPRA